MSCSEIRDRLSELVDGALDHATDARVRAHLAGCAECRAELRALEETVKLLKGLEPVPAPPDLLPRIRQNIARGQGAGGILAFFGAPQFRIAAAACLVCAFCIYGYFCLEGPVSLPGSAETGGGAARIAGVRSELPPAVGAMAKKDELRREETADLKKKARESGSTPDAEYKRAMARSAASPELLPRESLANISETTAARDKATAPADRERFGGRRVAAENRKLEGGGTYADRSPADTPVATAALVGRDVAKSARGPSPAEPAPIVAEAESGEETGKIWGGDKAIAAGRGGADETRLKFRAASDGPAESAADDSAAAAAPAMGFAPASPATRPSPVESQHGAALKETGAAVEQPDRLRSHSEVATSTTAPGEQAAPANEPASQLYSMTVTTRKRPDEVQSIIDKFAVADGQNLEKVSLGDSIAPTDSRQPAKKAVSGEVSVRIEASDYPHLIEQLRTVGSVTDERPPPGWRAVSGRTLAAEQSGTVGKTLLIRIRIVQK